MEFNPRFNQSSFSLREVAAKDFNRIDVENCLLVLVICVKVGTMMLSAWLGEYSDNDAKKATDFRHL
jgi:hypothetical protein